MLGAMFAYRTEKNSWPHHKNQDAQGKSQDRDGALWAKGTCATEPSAVEE